MDREGRDWEVMPMPMPMPPERGSVRLQSNPMNMFFLLSECFLCVVEKVF